MENQTLNDFPTETRVDVSANLLETSHMEPDLNRTEKEFLYQNEIINQELKKYNYTCSMCILKAWIFFYVFCLVVNGLLCFLALIPSIKETSLFIWALRIFILGVILFFCISSYGCLLLWMAINSKDLFKVEKSLFLSKIALIWSSVLVFGHIGYCLFEEPLSWRLFLINLPGFTIPILNFATAICVKKVLLKRQIFERVSSYPTR